MELNMHIDDRNNERSWNAWRSDARNYPDVRAENRMARDSTCHQTKDTNFKSHYLGRKKRNNKEVPLNGNSPDRAKVGWHGAQGVIGPNIPVSNPDSCAKEMAKFEAYHTMQQNFANCKQRK
jgi:hypothetical protein